MKNESKPQVAGRPRRNPKAAATATFSIRLTPEEREWIDEAAALRQEPAASLARKGAVDRALDFLNWSGAEDELRGLAEQLASQLNPAVLSLDGSKVSRASDFRPNDAELAPGANPGGVRITGVSYFSRDDTDFLLDVLQTATIPFVEMLVESINASIAKERGYTPLAERRKLAQEVQVSPTKKTTAPIRKSTRGK